MSADTPESIPTSADPKSHRPTKKRALTPVSAQAASVTALFANPVQAARLESRAGLLSSSSSTTTTSSSANATNGRQQGRLPPEIVANVQGSSAGAGSGEFHVYKASRRREYERLRGMEAEVKREKEGGEFERLRRERMERDEEATRRKREKREKARARKMRAKEEARSTSASTPVATDDGAEKNGGDDDVGEVARVKGNEEEMDADGGLEESIMVVEQPAGLVIHDDD